MAGADTRDQFSHHARAVAIELHGEPNKQLSSAKELRFGKHGSLSVDLEKGTFYDHQEGEGGGVLWAIQRQHGLTGAAAVEWMRSRGFDVEDNRPAQPQPQAAQSARLDPSGNWLPPTVPDNGRLTKAYDYRDASGELSYQVCRYDWEDPTNPKGHSKTFFQRRPDSSKRNGFAYKMTGVTWLPYRLPELIEDVASGYPIFIVEGEKKVDMLREIGVPATCNHGGAGKFPDELAIHFKGARVIILPDNDDAGRAHAGLIARRLDGVAASVLTLDLPGLPPKGGVDDWLPAGGSAERLYDLVDEAARPAEIEPYQSKFEAVDWADLDAPGPKYEELVKGLLTENEVSMLLGESQSGKSFLSIAIGLAVARGVDFFGRKVRQGAVVYQAGESATGVRRKRLPAYRIGHDMGTERVPFTLLQGRLDLFSSDDPTEAFIEECLYWAKRHGQPLKLIVIDTFSRATPGANENDGKDMGIVLARCDLIRRKTGAHVMLVHHLNSGGSKARGHTSLFANVENVISVRKVEDAHDDQGRQIREWKIAKQKDGEDDKSFKFVLRGVEIGTDEDGEKVYSCIVDQPGKATGAAAPAETGITIGTSHAPILRAIYTAISTKGVLAPENLGIARGAMAVTKRDLWTVIRSTSRGGDEEHLDLKDGETVEDAQKRRADAERQAVKRATDALFAKGVMGIKDDWVWLTGKMVRGFEIPPGLGEAEADIRRRFSRRSRFAEADDGPPAGGAPQGPDLDLPFDAPSSPEDWT